MQERASTFFKGTKRREGEKENGGSERQEEKEVKGREGNKERGKEGRMEGEMDRMEEGSTRRLGREARSKGRKRSEKGEGGKKEEREESMEDGGKRKAGGSPGIALSLLGKSSLSDPGRKRLGGRGASGQHRLHPCVGIPSCFPAT